MTWNNAGSIAAVAEGNNSFVGTGTLLLGAFVGDAFIYQDDATFWASELLTISDNTHFTSVQNWPFVGLTIANGKWSILPCSPLRQSTATVNDLLVTLNANFASVYSLTSSDQYGTLNKAASSNNNGHYLTTAGAAVARAGTFGDDSYRIGMAKVGGGYNDAIVVDKTTALVTVFGDPTALLGIATKQYVDGVGAVKRVRGGSLVNVTISAPGATIGGVTAAVGERFALMGQNTPAQGGIYVYVDATHPMTRATDADSAAEFGPGTLIVISEGTFAGVIFTHTTAAPVVIGTTALTFGQNPSPGANTYTTASANALTIGPNGATNPTFNVDASTASAATGIRIKSAAATGGVAISVLSSGTNENLTIDAKGSGTITLGGTSTGGIATTRTLSSAAHAVTSASANAIAVGVNGTTNPAFNVDASTGSSATGMNIKSAAAAGGVAISVLSSGTNENLTIDAKGSGTITLGGTSTGPVVTGGQIKFPGTQYPSSDPNTLDDYEEGTWTPIDSSGAGLTFSVHNGRYIKIGSVVFVSCDLTFPTTANTSSTLIGGLPFTASNAITDSFDGLSIINNNAVRNDGTFITRNTTVISLIGTSGNLVNNSLYSAKTLTMSGWYQAAA